MKQSRWLSLLVLCTGFLLIVVDMTIVNVALPSIGRDLRFSPSGLAWVINVYLVAFAGLLPGGRGLGLREGADVLGAALVTASLMLGVYAIVTASGAIGVLAIALLGAFVLRQARARRPMLPLRLFRSLTLSGANAVQALMSAAFLSFFFLASLYLE